MQGRMKEFFLLRSEKKTKRRTQTCKSSLAVCITAERGKPPEEANRKKW